MENIIKGTTINTEIRWQKETLRKKKSKEKFGRILGLSIFDKEQKSEEIPTGYCGSIEILNNGTLQIWTNGKYQFIKKEIAIVLLNKLLDFYGVGLEEIDKRITKLELKQKLKRLKK